jgi:hypothetical protein
VSSKYPYRYISQIRSREESAFRNDYGQSQQLAEQALRNAPRRLPWRKRRGTSSGPGICDIYTSTATISKRKYSLQTHLPCICAFHICSPPGFACQSPARTIRSMCRSSLAIRTIYPIYYTPGASPRPLSVEHLPNPAILTTSTIGASRFPIRSFGNCSAYGEY